jgi:F-type H+-transporting ATPase subunit b
MQKPFWSLWLRPCLTLCVGLISVAQLRSAGLPPYGWASPLAFAMFGTAADLSPAEGFGFNFDIIETNILNLAVVIGVVVYLGGDVLNSLLKDRKEKILSLVKQTNDRFLEAEMRLVEAKQKLATASTKAIEIRNQAGVTALQTTQNLKRSTEEEIQRLEESKMNSVRVEEDKAISLVRQQVVRLSIERAFSILQTKIDASMQRRLIDAKVEQLMQLGKL